MDALVIQTMKLLKANRGRLTPQQFRTIKGQVLAGDILGAQKGMQNILTRRQAYVPLQLMPKQKAF